MSESTSNDHSNDSHSVIASMAQCRLCNFSIVSAWKTYRMFLIEIESFPPKKYSKRNRGEHFSRNIRSRLRCDWSQYATGIIKITDYFPAVRVLCAKK